MSLRLLLAGALAVLSLALAVVLMANEDVLEPPSTVWVAPALVPPTHGLTYEASRREANLRLLGLPDVVFGETLQAASRLGTRRDALRSSLLALRNEDPALVCDALGSDAIPVYYRAAELLLTGNDKAPVRSPFDASFGARWLRFRADEVENLYRTWEAHDKRLPADAAVALAALVLERAGEAIGEDRREPWQLRAFQGNDLDEVAGYEDSGAARPFERVKDLMPSYLATAQVLAEIVAEEPGEWGCGVGRTGD